MTVLVQAAPSAAQTQRLLVLARADGGRVGAVVGWCDLLADDAPALVRRLAKQPRLAGLRPMLQDLPDPAWILQRRLAPAIEAMADARLSFDALVRPAQLGALLTFAKRYPALPMVVDHGAKPDIAARGWQPWADDIGRIASDTGAFCKLSGLVTEAGADWGDETLQPYVERLLAPLSPDDRARIFGGNAAAFYRIVNSAPAGAASAAK